MAFQSRRRWCRACQARTEHRREQVEPPWFGGRNLLFTILADLAEVLLGPWICVRSGRARRF